MSFCGGGGIQYAGDAPHLDLKPATDAESKIIQSDIIGNISTEDIEQGILSFAIGKFAKNHLEEVTKYRNIQIDKIESEVHDRLVRVINYWDYQASKHRNQNTQKFQHAQKQASKFSSRLNARKLQLNSEREISALSPIILTRIFVVPKSLIHDKSEKSDQSTPPFNTDITKRKEVEASAMEAIMETERSLGFHPKDISKENRGFDILSIDTETKQNRYIEVKGRTEDAETVSMTRNEMVVALQNPDEYILAIVPFSGEKPCEPRYVRNPFKVDSDFDVSSLFNVSSIQFSLKRLVEYSETPR